MQHIAGRQRLAAEFIGTAGLLAVVVGSGIMGETLAGGNTAIALLANALATGAILVVLITAFGPLSGAHFNPAVTLAFLLRREIAPRVGAYYVVVQVLGGIVGTLAAHVMFDLPLLQIAETTRTGFAQWFSEAVATFGLVGTILATMHYRPEAVAMMVGLFISAGYWFTASTSFANPAVTIARAVTDTFAGIGPADVPAFIVAQLLGAVAATLLAGWMLSAATGPATQTPD
ncbi:aquaporin family protein [Thiohalocapsa halophila]|uniref:Aquaporin family protein n=2 Tax=Thiohalocapsa halophila TaxID=69359 RepID=A0ABS1CQ08_9GAMM|nr:aquaporin family protein [Thiohalocapsa halophila]